MNVILETTYKHKGHVRQLLSDDKGTVMIIVFGLKARSDMTLLGVRAALEMHKRVRDELKQIIAIGVTTGRVFCGCIGSKDRCEYALVGDTVNCAARIMCKVLNRDGILCDDSTVQQTQEQAKVVRGENTPDFTKFQLIKLKGKQEPVQIWCPKFVVESLSNKTFRDPNAFVARHVELARTIEFLWDAQSFLSRPS